jgi:hypothetical protein
MNIENQKLYEPSMLDLEIEDQVLPTKEEFSPKSQTKLAEDIVLQKNSRTTKQG